MLRCPQCQVEVKARGKTCPSCQADLSEATMVLDEAQDASQVAEHHQRRYANQQTGDRTTAVLTRVGKYRILGFIGKGGMGHVYRALQPNPRREVALKLLGQGQRTSEVDRLRFRREAAVVAMLDHPYIVPIIEFGETDFGEAYYTMPLVKGVPLDDYVRSQELQTEQILELMVKVCEGVEAAHQRGAIHRDLKPGNILVTESGRPQILDFGLAKLIGVEEPAAGPASDEVTIHEAAADLSLAYECLGTPAFMAPEQTLVGNRADTRSDTYSLGVVLYLLLTNHYPYQLDRDIRRMVAAIRSVEPCPPREVASMPRDLECVLLKALRKSADERYQSAAAFAEDLGRLMALRPVQARKQTGVYRLARFLRREWLGCSIAVAALIGVSLLIAAAFLRVSAERDEKDVLLTDTIAAKNEATRMRSVAEESLGLSLIAQGDAQSLLGDLDRAYEFYRRASDLAEHYPAVRMASMLALWEAYQRVAPPLLAFEGHVQVVCVDDQERLLAAGGHDGLVAVYQLRGGQLLHRLEAGRSPIVSLAFDPSGQYLLSGDWDGNLCRWSCPDGRLVDSTRVRTRALRKLAVHGAQVVSLSIDGVLTENSLPLVGQGREVCVAVTDFAVSGDRIWYVADRMLICRDSERTVWERAGVAGMLVPDGKSIYVIGENLQQFDGAGKLVRSQKGMPAELVGCGMGGGKLIGLQEDGSIWDLNAGSKQAQWLFSLSTASVSGKNGIIAGTNELGRSYCQLASFLPVGARSLELPAEALFTLAETAPLGVVGSHEGVAVLDLTSGETLAELALEGAVHDLAVSRDGDMVAIVHGTNVMAWDLLTGQERRLAVAEDEAKVAVLREGSVVSASGTGMLRLFDRDGSSQDLGRRAGPIRFLAASSNAGVIVSIDSERRGVIQDLQGDIVGHVRFDDRVFSLAVTDYGDVLVARSGGSVTVLPASSYENERTFHAHDSGVIALTSWLDKGVLTFGRFGEIKLWNENFELLRTISLADDRSRLYGGGASGQRLVVWGAGRLVVADTAVGQAWHKLSRPDDRAELLGDYRWPSNHVNPHRAVCRNLRQGIDATSLLPPLREQSPPLAALYQRMLEKDY